MCTDATKVETEDAQVGPDYKQSRSFMMLEQSLSEAEVSGLVGKIMWISNYL